MDIEKGFIQFFQVTPGQLQEAIIAGVRLEIEKLRRDLQVKAPEEFLTRKEVCDMLKVDLSTLYNWTKKGKLRAYGIGYRVYYKKGEIEAALIMLSFQGNRYPKS